ncbi:MAG: hypothetical protein JWO28_1904, partial [Hyphomicrobiales bacterium]|nr:hypothetical protein [Hyphomicrobiales bacterium]
GFGARRAPGRRASPRNKRRAVLVRNHAHRRAVQRLQPFLRQHLPDRPFAEAFAGASVRSRDPILVLGGGSRLSGLPDLRLPCIGLHEFQIECVLTLNGPVPELRRCCGVA